MPLELDSGAQDFAAAFAKFLAAKREVSTDVEASARAIVDDVAARGDAALLEATQKFDRLTLQAKNLRVTAAEAPDYAERVLRGYLERRTADESFAGYVARAEQDWLL